MVGAGRPVRLGCTSRRSATLLACALLLGALGTAAASSGCAPSAAASGRRLLQAPPPPSSAPIIEIVEVDVVSQECVILPNAYYDVNPSAGVVELELPGSNLRDSARACCASCHELDGCNTFQWCPEIDGCVLGDVAFPYMGCQLLDISGFLNQSINTGQLKQQGPGVSFTSGSPLFFSVPKLDGYDVEIGRNLGGKFNYSCPQTLWESACVLQGSAQDLRVLCDADPNCLAFTFYPKGSPMLPDVAFGVLKGGEDVSITSVDTELNPNAAIYFKLEPDQAGDEGSDGGGSSSTVIIAVVASVVGTAAIAAGVLGYIYVRYRRLKASVADDRKPPGAAAPDGEGGAGEDFELGSGTSGPVPELSSADGGSPVADGGAGGSSATGSFASRGSGQLDAVVLAAAGAVLAAGSQPAQQQQQQSDTSRAHQALFATAVPRNGSGIHSGGVWGSGSGGGGGGAWGSGGGGGGGGTWDGLPSVEVQEVSAPSSGASGMHTAAWEAALYHQQYAQQAQQQAQQYQAPGLEVQVLGWAPQAPQVQQQGELVVEVAQAVPAASGGTRSDLPPSMQQAGTARELLEVFARMYSQRPAVDYAVVAEMLDQDADPSAVSAAESADEERLRRIDEAAAAARAAARSRPSSAPPSGAAPGSGSAVAGLEAMIAEALRHAAAASAQQQQDAEAAAPAQGAVQGPAPVLGSAQLEQEMSLLPGMISPQGSMLPPPSEWSLQPEEIEICKRPDGTYWQLGTGAFGTCYKGLYHGQQLVAVKVLHRVEERRRGDEFEREVSLLKDLRDRNIVQFIGACLDGPTPMLVTEFMEFGDLWRALPLKNPAGQRIFAWAKRGRRVLFDVAKGLHYLHQRRIVHLDLKSANILLSRHGTAKICDIGMARVLGNKNYLSILSGMGTFAWSAPEVLSGKRCSEKVDLYSFGVVIWEVCTGDVPVRGEMRPLRAPCDCPQEVVDLYERCVAEQPEQRPTTEEVLCVLGGLL